jgi:hypothetical protein
MTYVVIVEDSKGQRATIRTTDTTNRDEESSRRKLIEIVMKHGGRVVYIMKVEKNNDFRKA